MSNFSRYNPFQDPAYSGKASYLAGQNGGYPASSAAFNQWLYTPMDRRPTPQPLPANYTAYGTGSVRFMPHFAAGGFYPGSPLPTNQTPQNQGFNPTGIGGNRVTPESGSPADLNTAAGLNLAMVNAVPNVRNSTGYAQGQINSGTLSGAGSVSQFGAPAQPMNSMQRWGALGQFGPSFTNGQPNPGGQNAPLQPSSAQRFFMATGRIDGRAPQAAVQDGLQTGPAQGYRSVQFLTPDQRAQVQPVSGGGYSGWNTGGYNDPVFASGGQGSPMTGSYAGPSEADHSWADNLD